VRREDFYAVESILYSVPELMRYLDYKDAMFAAGEDRLGVSAAGGGAAGGAPQQRIVERAERDGEYKVLRAAAEKIVRRFLSAPPAFRDLIRDFYFFREDLLSVSAKTMYSPRQMYRLKGRAIEFMAPVCQAWYSVISAWKRRLDADMARVIKCG
jgi:hypothetical protein